MGKLIKGGCLCKKIRYEAAVEPKWISICHCRMCQKAYGNTSAIFVAFDVGQLEFTSGFPKYFKSSDIAKRGFCSECGSPIVFSYKSLDAVFIGTLDDPVPEPKKPITPGTFLITCCTSPCEKSAETSTYPGR